MPRILHITTDFLPGTGGLERMVRDLAVQSQRAGLDVSVLCLNRLKGHAGVLPPEETIDGLTVRRISFFDWKYYKPTKLPLKLLKQADILHVHGIGGPLDFAAATKFLHHRPIVASTHGGIFHTQKLAAVKEGYFKLVRALVLPRVDRLVACGQADRQLFIEHGVSGASMSVIDNGLDVSRFQQSTGVERVPGRLLFVGRIAPSKQVDDLIRVLAELRNRGVDATLRVVGPDRYQLIAGLRELAANVNVADAVTFAGDVPDEILPAEYQAADLFVSASRHEGFGISAVEAMAAGCVPVLNDIPAFPYLLGNSNAGKIARFADDKASADVISALLKEDREPRRQAAEDTAKQFSWDALILKWIALYESLVARASRP